MYAVLNPSDPYKAGTKTPPSSGIYKDYGLIQGHLLNADLGGKGENKNIFPISFYLNSCHKGFESAVKNQYRRLGQGERLYYTVEAQMDKKSFESCPDLLDSSRFICEYGIEKDTNNNTLRIPRGNATILNDTKKNQGNISIARESSRSNAPSTTNAHIIYGEEQTISYKTGNSTKQDQVATSALVFLTTTPPTTGTSTPASTGIYSSFNLTQGHLLNALPGGQAINRNLFPISNNLNTLHSGIEGIVKRLYAITEHPYIYYKVSVILEGEQPFKSARDLINATSLLCEFAETDEPDTSKLLNKQNIILSDYSGGNDLIKSNITEPFRSRPDITPTIINIQKQREEEELHDEKLQRILLNAELLQIKFRIINYLSFSKCKSEMLEKKLEYLHQDLQPCLDDILILYNIKQHKPISKKLAIHIYCILDCSYHMLYNHITSLHALFSGKDPQQIKNYVNNIKKDYLDLLRPHYLRVDNETDSFNSIS